MNIETILNLSITLDRNISLAQELNITADEAALADRAEACMLSAETSPDSKDLAPEEMLIQAVVLQAVEDWRCAVERLRLIPGDPGALAMKRDAETFFRSRWFRMLIDLNGADLLERLRKLQGWTDPLPAQGEAAHRMDRFQRSINYKGNPKGRKRAG